MKLSIVMPVYNVEKYIRECVDSVLNQTMKDYELIIVDDGSTDSSGAILDEYQRKDSRITVIHKENGGVSAARNDALKKCTGDYIYIMDSDDYLEPDAIQVMYDEAVQTDADVVITDHWKFTDYKEQRPCHFFSKEFTTDNRKIILQIQKMVLHDRYSPFYTNECKGVGIGTPWCKLLKRELIINYSLSFDPYVRGVFDDCLFSLMVFEHAKKVAYRRICTYHFRVLQTSLTHRYRANQLETYDRIFERIRLFGEQNKKENDYEKAYYGRVLIYLVISFHTYFFHKEYSGSIRKNYREFIDTLKKEPYCQAIRNVDKSILNKAQKRTVWFAKHHLGWALWLLYTIKKYVSR